MNIVIIGLSITSSWGNGHATTYRALVLELTRRGHEVVFLEQDATWYSENRDLRPESSTARVILYQSFRDLKEHSELVENADAVIVGSYVPEGIRVCNWVLDRANGVVAFYDIDTPVTLAAIRAGTCEYLNAELIPRFHVYLSFTGGTTLKRLEDEYGSPCARALYCSVDPGHYFPEIQPVRWDLGYLGTYSVDRQPGLGRLLVEPARDWREGRFVVAGPQYPNDIAWPQNVERIEHLAPDQHRWFYNSQRFTLNITRSDMIAAGYSPSVRLFEAAACGTPIISDWWEGIGEIFAIGEEILIAHDTADVLRYLKEMAAEELMAVGEAGRQRVLAEHTASHRAAELQDYLEEASSRIAVSIPPFPFP
jgi:spore maturation protein CgeB